MDPTQQFSQRRSWDPDLLKEYLDARLQELDSRLVSLMNERDRRYEQRFEAQQQALYTALVAQEKAVLAALGSADRAVTKAEEASEKRFDSVNEFRQTLSDQATLFIPRSEAEARIATNGDKIAALQARVDRSEGNRGGVSSTGQALFAIVIAFTALVSVIVAIITVAYRH